jgi:hypothetical protein
MEGQTENFTPRGQNSPLWSEFVPRGEVKNGPVFNSMYLTNWHEIHQYNNKGSQSQQRAGLGVTPACLHQLQMQRKEETFPFLKIGQNRQK